MKQYIKNIMILILALPWGLLLTNCSDSESDYSDDNAYPPPTVELTSPSEIDVVEYNSTVTVSAKSFSAVGIHSIYATLLKMDENGEYTGFDLELAEKVCELEGWELEKKPINWDSKDME